MSDLCQDIERIIVTLEQKMHFNQHQTFIVAFRKTRDTIIQELRAVQERLTTTATELRNEDSFAYLEKELKYFRDQSLTLDTLRRDMQVKNDSLHQLNETLSQQNQEKNKLLFQLTNDNVHLKSKLNEQKQLSTPHINQTHRGNTPSPPPPHGKMVQLSTLTAEPVSLSQSYDATARRPETTNKRTIRHHPHHHLEDNELLCLFKDCVNNQLKEIRTRKQQQNLAPRTKNNEVRNSQNELNFAERDYQPPKTTNIDKKELLEKFLEIIQAKVFNLKCCDNQNCLYNYQTKPKQVLLQTIPTQRLRSNGQVGRELLESYRQRGSSAHALDVRLEYRTRLGEMKQLERDMLSTSKRDKRAFSSMKNRITEINGQLTHLSRRIRGGEQQTYIIQS